MKLPKLWYTVKEAAQELDCTEDDVLHQIQIANLTPSFFFEKVKCAVSGAPVIFDENSPTRLHSGFVSLWLPDNEFCAKFISTKNTWAGNLAECLFVSGPFPNPDATPHFEVLNPVEPTPRTVDDILIAPEELERFRNICENESNEARPDSLSTKQESKYLKVIGALLAVHYSGENYKKGGDNSNISAIIGSIHKALAKNGISNNGLSDSTLKPIIKGALEAIEENRE